MLVMLDLSLCLAFPTVKESVRVRRNSKNEKTKSSLHPEEPVLMSAEVVWTPPLFCRPCRDSREESKHRVGEASEQSPDQLDRWRLRKTRRGTQLCTSLPLLKSHSIPRRRQYQEGMGVAGFSKKLRCSALSRSSIVAGSRVQFGQGTHYW